MDGYSVPGGLPSVGACMHVCGDQAFTVDHALLVVSLLYVIMGLLILSQCGNRTNYSLVKLFTTYHS